MSDLPARISVREVGPRDGLQNEDPVPTDAKIELIDRLSGTGVARIEAVSFVRPEAIPQMADASEVWQGITRSPSVRYSALVPNLRGAIRALDSGLTELEAVVSASDTHNRANVRRGTAESLDDIAVIIDDAHQRGRQLPGGGVHRVGLPVRGGRAGQPGGAGRQPGGGRRRGQHLVRRHHRHGHPAPGP